MIRRFAMTAVPLVCLLALMASLAAAAEDVLKLVPESAWGVAVVNRLADLDARLQALGKEMQLPVPSFLDRVKQMNMTDGLDENGSVALVLLPPEGAAPAPIPIILVPVSDYAKFLAQFKPEDATAEVTKVTFPGNTGFARKIGHYAAFTDPEHREVLEKTLKVAEEIPAILSGWRVFLGKSDAAIVFLPPGVKQLLAQMQKGVEKTKAALGQAPTEQTKAAAGVFEMYAQFFQAAEKQVAAFGIALQVDKQHALRLATRTSLVPEGQWAEVVGKLPRPDDNLLDGLPAGSFVVAGGVAVSDELWDGLLNLSRNMMKAAPALYGLSDEQIAKLPQLPQAFKGARSVSFTWGVGSADEPLYAAAVGAIRVDDSAAFMSNYEKDMKRYSEALQGVNSSILQPVTVEKDDVGGTPGLRLTTKIPTPPGTANAAQHARIMEAMFGPGGKVSFWMVPADKNHVVLGYVKKENVALAAKAIKQGKPDLSSDENVAKTVALLQQRASVASFLSPAGTLKFVLRMLPAVLPPQIPVPQNLPDFPATPPVGFSLNTAPHEVRTLMVVPGEVLQAVGPYVGKVMSHAMPPMQPGMAPGQ